MARGFCRFDPESDTFKYVRSNLTDDQLEAADGSGAALIVDVIRRSVGPRFMQEAVRLLREFCKLDKVRRIMASP